MRPEGVLALGDLRGPHRIPPRARARHESREGDQPRQLLPYGTDFYKYAKPLANGQLRGFATPSRKAEIFSSVLEELGYDPIPVYTEPETPLGNPELAKEYPLRLTTSGRISPLYHSEMRTPGHGTRSVVPGQ